MCQLFALNSNSPTDVTFSFTGFAARGGLTDEHADGWGIAFHGPGGHRLFVDDAPACASPLAAFLCSHPIRATTVLAHIRKATRGPVQLDNCHPFQRQWGGRCWSFCHNGTLHGFAPTLDLPYQPQGSTDSEQAFGWLMQQLQRRFGHRVPEAATLAPVLAELAQQAAAHGVFNFLLTDGLHTYAHCSTRLQWLRRCHPFSHARLIDADLSLDLASANGPADRMVLVATEPLTRNETWVPFGKGELQVFVAGEAVWRHAPVVAASPRFDAQPHTVAS